MTFGTKVDSPDMVQVKKLSSIVASRRKAGGVDVGDASNSGHILLEQVNIN